MKMMKFCALACLAMLCTVPTMAQGISLSTVANQKIEERQSDFVKFVEASGNYVKLQSLEVTQMKLLSTSTLGGYTLRVEKFTDLASNKSVQAVKVTPNSQTGIGKIVSGVSGLGRAAKIFYIDFDELPILLAHVEKMKVACEAQPTVNTTFSYITRDGFCVNLGYIVNTKKAVKLGQIGETGEIPFVDFIDELTRAFKATLDKFAELK